MPRRSPSPYSLALMRRVKAEHELDVSEPDLERWRTWRSVPLIPRRPSGVRVRWRPDLAEVIPPEEVDRVAEVARLVRRHRSLDVAGMILTARGELELDERAAGSVRDAFVAYWTRRLERAGDKWKRERRLTRGPRSSRRRSTLVREYHRGSQVKVEPWERRLATLVDLEPDPADEQRQRKALTDASVEDVCAALHVGQWLAGHPRRAAARRAYGHQSFEIDVLRLALAVLPLGPLLHEQYELARFDRLAVEARPRESERG